MAQPNIDRLMRIAGLLANAGHDVEFEQDSAGTSIKVLVPSGYYLFGQDINSPNGPGVGPFAWNWDYVSNQYGTGTSGDGLSGFATDVEVGAWAHAVISQREV